MNKEHRPMPLKEHELPEWLQREVDEIHAREHRDRMILLAIAGVIALAAACVALVISGFYN
jgi:hypothetical protein